jgi:organic hydroperoxide reductase OsmC/OhrA
MQKEAMVLRGDGLPGWRLVCDEGHYLNGSDLAPPPLAFFSAGMAAIYAASMAKTLEGMGHDFRNLSLTQDARYGMEGSALRGTMKASAASVILRATLSAETDRDQLSRQLTEAISNTPVESLLRTQLADTFSIERNGAVLATGRANQAGTQGPGDPTALFMQDTYLNAEQPDHGLVKKLESSRSVFEPDHGVGAALKDHQKRDLLIRSQVQWREDGLQQVRVQIHKPIGSIFQFIVDESIVENSGRHAPDGLSYLSAGIAFCFMTQLGRYVQITKQSVAQYSVVQDTQFDLAKGIAMPVETHVHLKTDEDVSNCQKIVDMGEQTCFLHAACRTSNQTELQFNCEDIVNVAEKQV